MILHFALHLHLVIRYNMGGERARTNDPQRPSQSPDPMHHVVRYGESQSGCRRAIWSTMALRTWARATWRGMYIQQTCIRRHPILGVVMVRVGFSKIQSSTWPHGAWRDSGSKLEPGRFGRNKTERLRHVQYCSNSIKLTTYP